MTDVFDPITRSRIAADLKRLHQEVREIRSDIDNRVRTLLSELHLGDVALRVL